MPAREPYRAFLSYAHADTRWARWLHHRLEHFAIDKDLVGRITRLGPVPDSLRQVFYDRADFQGGRALGEATIEALDNSLALVVLCSTIAARRPAVEEEVRLFRWRHPNRPVIPVIIEGNFPDCFPPALRFEITPEGAVSERPVTILGPDLRESGDGSLVGLAKIVAGMTGLGTDEIVRRTERGQRRRQRRWVVGLTSAALVLAGLAAWAEVNRRAAVDERLVAEARRVEAERNFGLAKNAANDLLVNVAQGLRGVEGMRASAVADILETSRRTLERLLDSAPDNDDLRKLRARTLLEIGSTYALKGNPTDGLKDVEQALAIATAGGRQNPADPSWSILRHDALSAIGGIRLTRGDTNGALAAYAEALANAQTEARRVSQAGQSAQDEEDTAQRWTSVIAGTQQAIGTVLQAQGKLQEALAHLTSARAALSLHSSTRRDHQGLVYAYCDLLHDTAKVHKALGDYPRALELLREAIKRLEPLLETSSHWTPYASLASSMYGSAAEVSQYLKLYSETLSFLQRALAITSRLLRLDPTSLINQSNVAVDHAAIGRLRLLMGQPAEALVSFDHALATFRRLVLLAPDDKELRGQLAWVEREASRARNALSRPEEAGTSIEPARSQFLDLDALQMPELDERP